MGVTGLWKLIEASGKPVPLETLENKVLAIDISIWLHQVVKGYQDNKGGQLPNAHLLGLFNRICKLLYFRIKPVFVFDGGAPELKRQTIAKRAQSKSNIQNDADRLERLLLEALAKEKIIQQAMGDPEKLNLSPPKVLKLKPTRTEERDEMFMLPPIEEGNQTKASGMKAEEDDEDDELCPKRSYDVNINKIDVTSTHFKSLPADIRHDILTDIKETRKQNSWARLRELPVESNNFSSYQMSRLIRRRQVQIGLEEAEQEMGGKVFSLSELESLMSEDGILDIANKAQKIASDENTRFLMVRDIAKAMQEAKKGEAADPSTSKQHTAKSEEPLPSTSFEVPKSAEYLSDEEDLDLQRAIQLSLGNEPDEEAPETHGRVKMNPEQRQKFSSTIQAHGLIRGFMMEYAEMNDDDIKDLMEDTQLPVVKDKLDDSFGEKFPNTDAYVLYGTPKKNQENCEAQKADDEDSGDDFVEIQEKNIAEDLELNTKFPPKKLSTSVVVTVDPNLKDFTEEDDLFADVFETSTQSVAKEDVEFPDVEVASISSDDDTIPYDISQSDLDDLHAAKETESGFASEEGKMASTSLAEIFEEVEPISENEKFWGNVDEPAEEPPKSPALELSENEEFWADEIVEIPDEPKLQTPIKFNQNESQSHLNISSEKSPTLSKAIRESSPPPAKVASPFFVKRTPSSKKKTNASTIIDSNSVVKSLFTSSENVETASTSLMKTAQELRANKTSAQLVQMKDQLVGEQKNLAEERNKLERMGTSITQSMSSDCKDLLKLFGIPYIDSPMEAEAQCAFLNMINLTDGTISDDSDIWLFGGQTVYKNFFVQKKIVMEFRRENIEEIFHLDRQKLIQLAMLVGSDYTVGINGIGAVTALEILAAFPPTPETEGLTDQYQSIVSSLRKFREWFQSGKQSGPGGKTVLKSKLKNVELFEGFPNINIARAYLEPVIDTNAEKFSWGLPDSESLVEYAKAKLGWTRMKTEEILAPVMKRLNEKKQATIKDYFKSQVTKKFFDNTKMSKRVQKAVGKMGGEEETVEEKPKKPQKRKATAKKREAKEIRQIEKLVILSSDDEPSEPPAKKSSPEPKPSTSKASHPKPEKAKALPRKRKPKELTAIEGVESPVKKPAPRIPNTKQVIPQREKDKEEQEKTKLKAVEIFKKSQKKK